MSSKSKAQSNSSGRAVWLVILVVALLRIFTLYDFCQSNPLAGFVQGDPGVYWAAAERIASGKLIADTPLQITPLYPYLLAMVRLFGGGLVAVFLLQNIVHLATGILLGRLANARYGGYVGLVVMSLFFLMQEPAVLVNRVLPGTWQLLCLVSVLPVANAYAQQKNFLKAAMAGLLMGTLVLLYPPGLLLVPALFYQVWLGKGGSLSQFKYRIQHAVTACGLALLVIGFATLHNWLACGEFIPLTAHAGITLRQGNAPGSDGRYTPIAGVSQTKERMHQDTQRVFHQATGRAGSFREVDQFFGYQAWRYMLARPGDTICLMARKAYWFATGCHYGDIYFPTLEQKDGWLRWLWLTPIPVAWLMGPALLGLIWCVRRQRLSPLDVSTFMLPLVVVVVFWYSPRYRFPAIPVLCFCAGAAMTSIVARMMKEKGRYTYAMGFLICIGVGPGMTAWNDYFDFDRAESYRDVYEYNRGQLFVGMGQHEKALVYFDKAYKLAPDRHMPLLAMTASLAALGRIDEAIATSQQLVSAHNEVEEAWLTLGGLYLRIGQWSRAASAFRSMLKLALNNSPAHFGMWLAMVNSGHAEEGVAYLAKAVELDPSNDLAVAEYGLWLARTGDVVRAKPFLARSVDRLPGRTDVREMLDKISK